MKGTLPGLQEHGSTDHFSHSNTALQGRVFARALDDDGSTSPSEDHSLVQIGRIFAWSCTVFYLSSRMPQLWKNVRQPSIKRDNLRFEIDNRALSHSFGVLTHASTFLAMFSLFPSLSLSVYCDQRSSNESRSRACQSSCSFGPSWGI